MLHSSANLTVTANGTLPEEKKKTIAQIIDEALEQEFPEEKAEKIGKNYNETAQQEDVSRPPAPFVHASLVQFVMMDLHSPEHCAQGAWRQAQPCMLTRIALEH